MSDRHDKDDEQEKTLIRGENDTPSDEKTLVRQDGNADHDPHEANDDATLLRGGADQEPNDDETLLRSADPGTDEPNDDATLLRGESADPEPNDDATLLRSDAETTEDEAASEDATVIRSEPDDEPKPPAEIADLGSSESATILRAPSEDGATILRAPSNEHATILRGDTEEATILREGDTVPDDDRTIINEAIDDDATIIGPGGQDEDTTYVATAEGGGAIRSQGNSEAGRLLKNRFVLEEKIGSGGMGDVYKALDLRQQEAQERDPYIAIKLLNENFARHKDAFLSLQRETSRTRGIPHPNIMGVYDFDREGDTVFMSMELLDGKPLDDYLKEHPEGVSEEDAWNIIDGICEGLMRAHNAGIVHSDFKPGNIFYTKDKMAKVFDFGIARAVSSPGELEADGEKTVFDAGSLGALTPTYASYEMLTGLEPSKSDDVYAVALVAYELFMGKHPYDRVPADKALERGIQPKPVPFLKRRQWRALKKALALKGEDRTQTIDEFHERMFAEDPPYLTYAAVATVLVGSIGFGVYSTLNVKEVPEELAQYQEGMASAELTIENSLRDADDDPRLWENEVWHDGIETALTRWKGLEFKVLENEEWVEEWELAHDPAIEEKTASVLTAYLDEIKRRRELAAGFARDEEGVRNALELLEPAEQAMARVEKNYRSADPTAVTAEAGQLGVALQLREARLANIEEEKARIKAEEEAAIAAAEAAEAQRLFEEARLADYNEYLQELEGILRCKGKMPPEDLDRLGTLLPEMKARWEEAYEHHYPTIVNYLSRCIQQRIGFVDPDNAREVQRRVVSYLPGETQIANLVIEDKDPCDDRKLIGKGDRNRAWCSDRLSEGGTGPELVVIPQMGVGQDKYAISRSEIKIGEYNAYCANAGCQQFPEGAASSLPATNLSINQINDYMSWLTSQTGQVYRLPTTEEWTYAATVDGKSLDADENINCTVDSRGVRLGEKLLNALSGRPNEWGLYNHIGNARELTIGPDGNLLAVGGAHTDPRNECNYEKQVAHQGDSDPVTGFRIVREIQKKDAATEKADLAASGE